MALCSILPYFKSLIQFYSFLVSAYSCFFFLFSNFICRSPWSPALFATPRNALWGVISALIYCFSNISISRRFQKSPYLLCLVFFFCHALYHLIVRSLIIWVLFTYQRLFWCQSCLSARLWCLSCQRSFASDLSWLHCPEKADHNWDPPPTVPSFFIW